MVLFTVCTTLKNYALTYIVLFIYTFDLRLDVHAINLMKKFIPLKTAHVGDSWALWQDVWHACQVCMYCTLMDGESKRDTNTKCPPLEVKTLIGSEKK